MKLKEFLNLSLVYCSYDMDYDRRPITMTPKLEGLECGLHAMTKWHYSKLCHHNLPEKTEPLYLKKFPEDGYQEEELPNGDIKLISTPKTGWYIPDGQWSGQVPFTDNDLLNAEVLGISEQYGDTVYGFGLLLNLTVDWEN